jgi:tetratricopeptide (TPR) repeat protein
MKFAVWLLAVSGALASVAPVIAQDAAPAGNASTFQTDPMNNLMLPRSVPMTPTKARPPEAEACANSSGKVAPRARAEACGALIDSGKWKGADIAFAFSNRCIARKALGEQDKALADCDKAIELDGKDAVAFQARGLVLLDKGDGDRALADFDQAVALGAKNAALFSDRGNLLLAKGDVDKAIDDYGVVLDINAKSVSGYVERGGAWLAKGDFDGALADYSKAIELAPGDSFAIFNRGVAYDLKGDKAKAIESFKEALKLDPKYAYPGLWLFLAQSGAQAKAELKGHAAKFPPKAWPWPAVQYQLGELDAQRTLAAAKTPGDQCEAQFYIGAGLLARNARDEGLPYLRKAAEICPKNFIEYIRAAAQLKALGVETPKAETSPQPKAEPAAAPKAEPNAAPKAETGPVIRLEPSPEKADSPAGQGTPQATPQVAPQPAEPAKSEPAPQPQGKTDSETKPESAPQSAPAAADKPADGKN